MRKDFHKIKLLVTVSIFNYLFITPGILRNVLLRLDFFGQKNKIQVNWKLPHISVAQMHTGKNEQSPLVFFLLFCCFSSTGVYLLFPFTSSKFVSKRERKLQISKAQGTLNVNQNCKQNSLNQFLVYYVFGVGLKIDIIMCKEQSTSILVQTKKNPVFC